MPRSQPDSDHDDHDAVECHGDVLVALVILEQFKATVVTLVVVVHGKHDDQGVLVVATAADDDDDNVGDLTSIGRRPKSILRR